MKDNNYTLRGLRWHTSVGGGGHQSCPSQCLAHNFEAAVGLRNDPFVKQGASGGGRVVQGVLKGTERACHQPAAVENLRCAHLDTNMCL